MIGVCACEMEELPQAQLSKKTAFNSEAALKLYTNSFYNQFPENTTIYTNSYYIALNQVIKYFTANGFSAEESSGWNWVPLRNINYFIANNTDESIPVEMRNNYNGIARFFSRVLLFRNDETLRRSALDRSSHGCRRSDFIRRSR